MRSDLIQLRIRDEALLVVVLNEDAISDEEREAFEDMLIWVEKRPLSPKQRGWVSKVASRLGLDETDDPVDDGVTIPADTRFSSGDIPRGREVESMVRDKPLRPPQRRMT